MHHRIANIKYGVSLISVFSMHRYLCPDLTLTCSKFDVQCSTFNVQRSMLKTVLLKIAVILETKLAVHSAIQFSRYF